MIAPRRIMMSDSGFIISRCPVRQRVPQEKSGLIFRNIASIHLNRTGVARRWGMRLIFASRLPW